MTAAIIVAVGLVLLALSKGGFRIVANVVADPLMPSTIPYPPPISQGPDPANLFQDGVQPPPGIPWPPARGQPGFVMVGGIDAPPGFSMEDMGVAIKTMGVATAVVGSISGLAQGFTAATGTVVLPALGAVLPIIGAGLAAVGIVMGIIAKHHAAAMAMEATLLNHATPIIRQRQVLIAQAAIVGEINYDQANQLVSECISDFYQMIRPVQRGTWHWNPAYNDSSAGFWPKGMNQSSPNAHAPDPCNAACWYGHFAAEGDCFTVLLPTIKKILAGQHGNLQLSKIPANSGEIGFPEVDITY